MKRVFDQNLDFVSLERDVFSIMRPDAFKKLSDPKSRGDRQPKSAWHGCHEWIVCDGHDHGSSAYYSLS